MNRFRDANYLIILLILILNRSFRFEPARGL